MLAPKATTILEDLNIEPISVLNFKYSSSGDDIKNRIFESRGIEFDIIESENNYILYKIYKAEKRIPDISDPELKMELLELISQKNKFDYNRNLLNEIEQKKFNNTKFLEMGGNKIETFTFASACSSCNFNTSVMLETEAFDEV